jgi:two-component system, NarL family, response regulator
LEPMNPSIRVLIADDHPVTREGMAAMIDGAADMTVVGQASDGEEAVALFRAHTPDVAMLDLRMPRMTGSEATTAILREFPRARVIVLSAVDGDEAIYRALQAGARGYLLKDLSREELLEAVRAVHAGQHRIPGPVAARLAERIAGSELTPRETAVLRLMAAGESNRQIAEALAISESGVKGHVNNIFSKLGVSDRTQAVTAALRRGIVQLE